MINVELLTRDAEDRVTSAAREDHADMDAALKAARRLAGKPRGGDFTADASGALSISGPNGTAYVIR